MADRPTIETEADAWHALTDPDYDWPAEASERVAAEELAETKRILAGVGDDLARHVALLEYVEEYLLDDDGRARVAGFVEGWVSATRD